MRVGEKHVESMWHDAARRAGSGIPCASLRPAASDGSAAPLVPCPCFIALYHKFCVSIQVNNKLDDEVQSVTRVIV